MFTVKNNASKVLVNLTRNDGIHDNYCASLANSLFITLEEQLLCKRQYKLFLYMRDRFIRNLYHRCQNFKKLLVLSQTTPIEIRNRIHIFQRKIFTVLFFMAEVLGGILCVLVFVRLRLIRHLLPMSNPILDLRTWYFTFSLLNKVL